MCFLRSRVLSPEPPAIIQAEFAAVKSIQKVPAVPLPAVLWCSVLTCLAVVGQRCRQGQGDDSRGETPHHNRGAVFGVLLLLLLLMLSRSTRPPYSHVMSQVLRAKSSGLL